MDWLVEYSVAIAKLVHEKFITEHSDVTEDHGVEGEINKKTCRMCIDSQVAFKHNLFSFSWETNTKQLFNLRCAETFCLENIEDLQT